MILLDTDVLIEIERNNEEVITKLSEVRAKYPGEVGITSAVYSEILFGYLKKNKQISPGFDSLEIVDFDKDSAKIFAVKKKELEQKGTPIPLFDLLTASCTLAHEATLVTSDSHFKEVKGLKVIFV